LGEESAIYGYLGHKVKIRRMSTQTMNISLTLECTSFVDARINARDLSANHPYLHITARCG
jgi:hypothetical protein